MTTFADILNEFREIARSKREQGDLFERLIVSYLKHDPQYANLFSDIWLWSEWPDHVGMDTGIDLVAREASTGNYWAIQCKFFDPDYALQKGDIDSFFTASGKSFATREGKRSFTQRLIVSTTDKWSSNATKALENQTIPCSVLNFAELADSPIDWCQFSLKNLNKMRLRPKKELREHQTEAIEAVVQAFKSEDRGKLIMACGTGKTFTALKLMEKTVPKDGRVLFLAPSIALVSQTLREWTAEAATPIRAMVVCSDSHVGREDDDIRIQDLAYPATTDPKNLVKVTQALAKDPDAATHRTVIFSTYQSIQVVADAQKAGLGEFDLIICDEAHRTTGMTRDNEDASEFLKVHDNKKVRAKKRLYMTATPRIFADKSKKRAVEDAAVLYSMDDEEKFGRDLYTLSFGKAVTKGLLTEYKVLIVAVEDQEIARIANEYNMAFTLDDKTAIDSAFATKIIGTWKGLSKKNLVTFDEDGKEDPLTEDTAPMRRAVAFSSSIKKSQQITDVFARMVERYVMDHPDGNDGMVHCQLDHVDGGMNSTLRLEKLGWLKESAGEGACRILSNARCLTEGVDVPTLDAVIFHDTRNSMVDIVQAVGRVMRIAEGKKYGYIILPVCIPKLKLHEYNAWIDKDEQFKGIWKVIKALRAHDERLVDEVEFRNRVKTITDSPFESDGAGSGGDGTVSTAIDEVQRALTLNVPIEAINEAVYAAIPRKLGDREYWSEWAKSIGDIAENLIKRIEALIEQDKGTAKEFERFLKGLQDTLNPSVSRAEAIEMLAQHILTLPVFKALFAGSAFPDNNPVAQALQKIVQKLDRAAIGSETESLTKFYANVEERIALAKSDKSKQDVIRNLYDTFFNNAFPRMAERLGIVYTPIEVVDFILQSVQAALKKHFNLDIGDKDIHILDPFSGTGTFIVRLLQSGLIDQDKLQYKYLNEMHANEIVLLAYYIATINIETAFHGQTGKYLPFEGMVLTDTFQMTEKGDLVDEVVLPENNAKASRQLNLPIMVIVGNPPYSAQQASQNDNNQNLEYPTLDNYIANTYAFQSSAANKKNLYDSYIRAIRWASNRIDERGIVAFVTNGSFLDANNMDGLRKCLTEEYSQLYVFNLRGNQRTSGEESRREGGKIFGSGSRTPVAITVMVKDPNHQGACELHYHDIGDYLSREEKLKIVQDFGSIDGVSWEKIRPNEQGDWVNQRDPAFENFLLLGDKQDNCPQTIFSTYSLGLGTNRDAWVYNFSRKALSENMLKTIATYNSEVDNYAKINHGKPKDAWSEPEEVVTYDPKRISWSSSLLPKVKRGIKAEFCKHEISNAVYRPFCKVHCYYDDLLIHRIGQWRSVLPDSERENKSISVNASYKGSGDVAIASDNLMDLHSNGDAQCFPLYWYEKVGGDEAASANADLIANDQKEEYVRHDAITDWALTTFRDHYKDKTIEKHDIFHYVYGVLHSPEYKQRFAADLKKMLPRIPLCGDFWAFSKAGERLMCLHLNYEEATPYQLKEEKKRLLMEPSDYRVHKMAFGKKNGKPDKTVIVYNENLTLSGIPMEAYEYVVNGKSAIEWIMERYAVTVDKDSGIKNDPNDWSDDPRYIVDLLKRIVRVSIGTVDIVNKLPPLKEHKVD